MSNTHMHHTPTQSFRVWNKPVEWQLAPILQPWQPAQQQEIAQPSGSETVNVITLYRSPSSKYITCVHGFICVTGLPSSAVCSEHKDVAFPVISTRLLIAYSSKDQNRGRKKREISDAISNLFSAKSTRNSDFFLSAILRDVV